MNKIKETVTDFVKDHEQELFLAGTFIGSVAAIGVCMWGYEKAFEHALTKSLPKVLNPSVLK